MARGLVANPVTLDQSLEIDFDRYREHIAWLAASGCDGVTPNGSLGEYQTLTGISQLGATGSRGRGRRGDGAAAKRLSRRRAHRASVAADTETALPLYRLLHPLLRWDSKTEFVQAIKLSMDIVGREGGRCRPPRFPLAPAQEAEIRRLTEQALASGLN